MPVLTDYRLYYPDEALERGLEGTVVLRLVVTEDGRTEDVHIYRSCGYILLDSAAVRTAETFVFSPAVVHDRTTRSRIMLPLEFKLSDMNLETWITEVKVLQQKIERSQKSEDIEELYNFYKQLIYSTRLKESVEVNDYIKDAVLERTATLWEGYWLYYSASSLLFIDIIRRYPHAFVSMRAEVDYRKYIDGEVTRIRRVLLSEKAEILIDRLYNALND